LLEIIDITKYFGGLPALRRVSFRVKNSEILGVIGPNGAGKTTLFNIINGIIKPSSGKIIFNNMDITNMSIHRRAAIGISRTFQIPRPFLEMSTLENVILPALSLGNKNNAVSGKLMEEALEILREFDLHRKAHLQARHLNLQEKKSLELARALLSKPKVLLVDEYLSGLNPTEIENAVRILRRLRDENGITILCIDHVISGIIRLADRAIVLHYGQKIAEGEPMTLIKSPEVIHSYLGDTL